MSWRGWCTWTISVILLILFLTVLIHLWIVLINRNELFYVRRFSIGSWWKHASIWRSIFIFFIVIYHLRKIKSFYFLFINSGFIIAFLFNTCLWSFWAYRNLKILKCNIGFNDSLNCSHVRVGINMECFNELTHMVRTLPLLHSLK